MNNLLRWFAAKDPITLRAFHSKANRRCFRA